MTAAVAARVASRSEVLAQDGRGVVLITGAGSGFGRNMALTFARNGYRVYATMRDPNGRKFEGSRFLLDRARDEGFP